MPTMVKVSRLVPRGSGVSVVTVSDFRRLAVAIAGRERLTPGLADLPTGFADLPTGGVIRLRSVERCELLSFMLRPKRGRSNELPAPKRIGVLLKSLVATRNVDFLALYCLSRWLSELVFVSRQIAISQTLGSRA